MVNRRGAFNDIFKAAKRYFNYVLLSNFKRECIKNVKKRLDFIKILLKRIENLIKI